MKAVSILALTTTISLGGVILLYIDQQELKEQLSTRASTVRAPGAEQDVIQLEAVPWDEGQIELVVERYLTRQREAGDTVAVVETPGAEDTESVAEDSQDPLDLLLDEPGAVPDNAEMREFRGRVRRAQELNRREDEVRSVFETLDRLSDEGRIAALADDQKRRVTSTILKSREEGRNLWRRVRDSIDTEGLTGDQRRTAWRDQMRVEYETLRSATVKQMEEIVPAADAGEIIQASLRGGGGDRTRGRTSRRR